MTAGGETGLDAGARADGAAPTDGAVSASEGSRESSRLGTIAWALSIVLLVGVFAVLAVGQRSSTSGARFVAAIGEGKRPAAPPLPKRRLRGADTPSLPSWYRPHVARDDAAPRAGSSGVLVVNWWASWCGPCRDEVPELRKVARRFADRGVVVVGVNPSAEDTHDDALAFVREFEIDYPVVLADPDDKRAWGVRGFPETFVVGRDGRVSARIDGPVDRESIEALLDAELERGR